MTQWNPTTETVAATAAKAATVAVAATVDPAVRTDLKISPNFDELPQGGDDIKSYNGNGGNRFFRFGGSETGGN